MEMEKASRLENVQDMDERWEFWYESRSEKWYGK